MFKVPTDYTVQAFLWPMLIRYNPDWEKIVIKHSANKIFFRFCMNGWAMANSTSLTFA